MKKLKIFPKTFLYSLAIMLLIVGVAHLILYATDGYRFCSQ